MEPGHETCGQSFERFEGSLNPSQALRRMRQTLRESKKKFYFILFFGTAFFSFLNTFDILVTQATIRYYRRNVTNSWCPLCCVFFVTYL